MTRKKELAFNAARKAMSLRVKLGIPPDGTVCTIDIALKLSIVVKLEALPSLEGVYSPEKVAIVLSTERPSGRIQHTCGHEIGHHVFGHRPHIDGIDKRKQGWEPEEYIADRFATGLLMPKLAVEAALNQRQIDATQLDPEQTFALAQHFGVGYDSFISHLERTLKLITSDSATCLRKSGRNLRPLRCAIAGFDVPHDVFVADEHWGTRPMDIQTGDVVLIPSNAKFEGQCAQIGISPTPHLRGIAAGKGRLWLPERETPITLRVSRRGFTGLAKYRHLEDCDEQ